MEAAISRRSKQTQPQLISRSSSPLQVQASAFIESSDVFLQRMGGVFNIGGCLPLQDDPSYNLFWETAPTEHWHAFEDEVWGGGERCRPCKIVATVHMLRTRHQYTVQAVMHAQHATPSFTLDPGWQTDRHATTSSVLIKKSCIKSFRLI